MAKLKDKLENALNEARILILGGQVLIGFTYRAYFEPRFLEVGAKAKVFLTVSLGAMLASFGLLLVLAAYHICMRWRVPLRHRQTAGDLWIEEAMLKRNASPRLLELL